MNKWLEGWGDNVQAGILDGEMIVRPKPTIQQRTLTLDEIFNNKSKFREDLPSNKSDVEK